jgi:hypothetical protein
MQGSLAALPGRVSQQQAGDDESRGCGGCLLWRSPREELPALPVTW